jgi:hypothetical protein
MTLRHAARVHHADLTIAKQKACPLELGNRSCGSKSARLKTIYASR